MLKGRGKGRGWRVHRADGVCHRCAAQVRLTRHIARRWGRTPRRMEMEMATTRLIVSARAPPAARWSMSQPMPRRSESRRGLHQQVQRRSCGSFARASEVGCLPREDHCRRRRVREREHASFDWSLVPPAVSSRASTSSDMSSRGCGCKGAMRVVLGHAVQVEVRIVHAAPAQLRHHAANHQTMSRYATGSATLRDRSL